MPLSSLTSNILTYLIILLAIAFFTLLERKILGYIQIRKGPNKVGIIGLPQPFADAIKLFLKEQAHPTMTNYTPFYIAPALRLILALILWSIFPLNNPRTILPFSVILFLCISRLNVYATIAAGWSSNSKYALLGALRGIAQTISYEVSIALILIAPLLIFMSYNFIFLVSSNSIWPSVLGVPLFFIWFITMLAETNRTPFDHAEGESELVSGFNTEYRSGPFALIFMAEYTRILAMSTFTAALFFPSLNNIILTDIIHILKTAMLAILFIWVRGTLPRIRYDRLMSLTWKVFLPFILAALIIITPFILLSLW